MTHPPEVGGVGVEGGGDGAFERDGSVGVEQLDESADEDAEVVVALGGGDEQGLGRGGGVVEAVGGAVLAGEAFVAFELFDVGGVLDLLAAVEGAGVGGKHGAGVEDAHGVQRGRDDEGAPDVTMGDGIVVCVESYVGCLAHLDFDTLLARERIVGKLKQVGALLGEDVGDGALGVLGTGALGGASPLHHSSAWSLRSSRSRNRRALKKLSRANLMNRSTRPFSFPRASATGRGSKR